MRAICVCIDKDGQNAGFDHALIAQMKKSVSIPVIARCVTKSYVYTCIYIYMYMCISMYIYIDR